MSLKYLIVFSQEKQFCYSARVVVTRDIKQAQVYSIYSLCDTCNTVRGIV